MKYSKFILFVIILLIVLVFLFFTTKTKEQFANIYCPNYSNEKTCEKNDQCVWCTFRGSCVNKGEYRECIKKGDKTPIFRVSVDATPNIIGD
jgi:hypothetical protein